METSHRAFVALGLLAAAVLSVVTVARFLTRPPDDALRPAAPPVPSVRAGGPPAPSAEMESGITFERTPLEPLPSPRNRAPAVQVPAARAPMTRTPSARVPAPRDAPRAERPAAAPGPSSPGGNQSEQFAAPTGPAAPGANTPPADALRDLAAAAPQVAPAPVLALPPAPAPAATPHPAPVLTPPVPVTLDPPRHPDAWRVVVESPGLTAEVRPEGLTARVRLRLRLRDDGAVEHVEIAVSSGRPELDAAAAAAARTWRFLPARRDGVAIASAVLIWVAFVIGP